MTSAKHQMLHVNDIDLHVVEQGEGPAVLLCHGFPETWYSWRHQIAALADAGFRAIAPDLRGFGESDRPEEIGRFTLLDIVGDVVGLLDALKVEKAVLVGNDWGATVAWHAALLRPDRFHGVVALGVPMMDQPPVPPTSVFPQTKDALFYTLYFQTPTIAEKEFECDVRLTMRKILFAASGDAGPRKQGDGTPNPFGMVSRSGMLAALPDPSTLPDWLTEADLETYVAAFAGSGFRGGLNLYRNMDRNRELLACSRGLKVTIPALYIVGERDTGFSIPGMKQIIDNMPALVPLLRDTIVLPACGHWTQQEKPNEVNAALIAFIQGLPNGSSAKQVMPHV